MAHSPGSSDETAAETQKRPEQARVALTQNGLQRKEEEYQVLLNPTPIIPPSTLHSVVQSS